MISPSSTNPKVTEAGDDIFRVCYIDPFQGMVIAKFAKNTLHFTKGAVFRDNKNDYSVGLANYFTESFHAMGGLIVSDEAYSEGDQDFKAQLTVIKSKKPEFIFVPGYYPEVGLIARQARELGITVPLLGGDGWVSDELLKIGGDALNGCYYSKHLAPDAPDTSLQGFITRYKAKNGGEPDAIAGLAYDAARLLFDSMRRLQAADPKAFEALDASHSGDTAGQKAARAALRDQINGAKNFAGV